MTQFSSTFTLTTPSEREIVLSRLFDAPRELIFEVCSSCEHLARWLGPRTMTMVSCEMDFRPGGRYRYIQRGPDGAEYGFRGEIREITPPARIVQTFEFEGMPGHIALETLTLEEHEGKTRLTVRALYDSVEDRDGILQSGMEGGVRESWDRLEEYLATRA
jgi:uncharacterized protein YndB with AHSA1/START domain